MKCKEKETRSLLAPGGEAWTEWMHVKHGAIDVQWQHDDRRARLVHFATGQPCGGLQNWAPTGCPLALSRIHLIRVGASGNAFYTYNFSA
jgi:hypothetical protein